MIVLEKGSRLTGTWRGRNVNILRTIGGRLEPTRPAAATLGIMNDSDNTGRHPSRTWTLSRCTVTPSERCILLMVKHPGFVPVKTRLAASLGEAKARSLYETLAC
jgi:hypothetical protein